MDKLRYCKAFSLVEISISITIIALLISAIIVGQNVKKRLELNQIIEQVGNINTAVKKFKTIYEGALPGDMFNATTIFNQSNLLDGNGNNILENNLSNPPRNEHLLFWQDLAASTLINGEFDGKTIGKEGLYGTSFKNVYFYAETDSNDNNRLYLLVSKIIDEDIGRGTFSTEEAFDYDTKYDDGDPNSGAIRSQDGKNKITETCIKDKNYNLSNKSEDACAIRFYIE